VANQKPSSPKKPSGSNQRPASPKKPSDRPHREPARPDKGGAPKRQEHGTPLREPSGRPAAQRRPREPRPTASAAPREGRLVAGHEEDLLYGRHAVAEALRAGRRHIRRIFLAQGVDRTGILSEIVATARLIGCPVIETPRERLDDAVGGNHQGVVAQAAEYPYVDLDQLLATPGDRLYLALDHLQDVQNLGTLLRTAEAMRVSGVVLPGRRSAGVTPAVVNASAGAVEHLEIALVSNLVQALEALKESGAWVAGLEAAPEAKPLAEADLIGPLVLVVGAEGAGLSRLVRERCDWLVEIPMFGKVESLNAAVAASVVLVAARHARMQAASRELPAGDSSVEAA
jgi:23S rRNA (guanosine2251-2'-O)-methyltransferase